MKVTVEINGERVDVGGKTLRITDNGFEIAHDELGRSTGNPGKNIVRDPLTNWNDIVYYIDERGGIHVYFNNRLRRWLSKILKGL